MEVVIGSAEQMAVLAADAVEELLSEKPDAVIGLATGSSPLALYAELARRHAERGLSFAQARAFLLDEYVGLPVGHPERYATVIERELTSHVDFAPGAVQVPDGAADDLEAACAAYEEAIAAAGGVDLQLLGIGTNGHLAFNEPCAPPTSRTHIETLTEQTRRDNARFFDGDLDAVPRLAMTQGLGTILDARHLVLLAIGPAKAEAVQHMVEGNLCETWPATVLQMHPHVTVLLDQEAASLLENAERYRAAWAGR